jgi:NAD(P)-dependent dehydrogenase (short-subunit alcohol dehydrogenase family)
LCRALARRGDSVTVADIDGAAAQRVADEIGGTAAKVDVRDVDGVAALVEDVVGSAGRLDLMVNNAGVGVGGDVSELTVAHWDRVIDVNLRGVVHGVQAAYPVMVRQRSGHIVNTASMAGLVPAPYLAPYDATKHAVVGLSLSLRGEASLHGVKVTVVCPGWIDTPLLDSTGPDDLPKPSSTQTGGVREMASRMGGLYSPDALAADIVRGIERNRPMVVAPRQARILWRMMRLSPPLFTALTGWQFRREHMKQRV